MSVKRRGVLLRLHPDLLERVDVARGALSRTAWLVVAIEKFLNFNTLPYGGVEAPSDLGLDMARGCGDMGGLGVGDPSEQFDDVASRAGVSFPPLAGVDSLSGEDRPDGFGGGQGSELTPDIWWDVP